MRKKSRKAYYRRLLSSYTAFTKTERIGLCVLLSIVLLLIIVKVSMGYFVHPPVYFQAQRRLQAAWQVFQRSQPVPRPENEDADNDHVFEDADDGDLPPLPAIININTADSATLVRLRGIGPATAAKIVAYRNEHGDFESVEELRDGHFISKATYLLLQKHLSTDTAGKQPDSTTPKKSPLESDDESDDE